ncbi:hypothetical protein ABIA65_004346 [Mycolicibacterium sp. 624]|uniref:DUF2599 domain-containing protein n=1 Tax=Mycolicibacterium sp. YH-1 TaxID=2908837 RepID=UPI003499835B
MPRLIAASLLAVAVAAALTPVTTPAASADPVTGPPFIVHTEWVKWGDLSSLRVYPTYAGRVVAGQPGTIAQGDEAWTEVLAISPDADIPGMREQFMCHWQFAEIADPGKSSWNLEPWRPEVDDATMFSTGCNPGGTEEPF